MALKIYHGNRSPTTWESIGGKVKDAVEIGLALKNIYGIGRAAYSGFAAAAPYIEGALLAAGL
jgi:hypothetical protein